MAAPAAACPVCGVGDVGARTVERGHEYVRCRGCGTWRLVDVAAMALGSGTSAEGGWRPPEQRVQAFGRTVVELERLTAGRRLLDVGCGRGELLEAARRRGWDVTGVEPFDALREEGERTFGLRLLPVAWGPGVVPAGSCDALVLHHMLEHTDDPAAALAAARAALVPGGVLHVATPNFRTLDRFLYPGVRDDLFDAPRHALVFSDRSLVGLLEREGFEIVAARPQVSRLLRRFAEAAVGGDGPAAAATSIVAGQRQGAPLTARMRRSAASLARTLLPGASVRVYARRRA